jgi:hypothetical protein
MTTGRNWEYSKDEARSLGYFSLTTYGQMKKHSVACIPKDHDVSVADQ